MSKFTKGIKYILIFFLGLIVLIGVIDLAFDYFGNKDSSIDSCLDLGGRWDYEKEECQYE